MPLIKSGSKKAISANIRAEKAAGKPHKQSIAIALDIARRAGKKKADGGAIDRAFSSGPSEPFLKRSKTWRERLPREEDTGVTRSIPPGLLLHNFGVKPSRKHGDALDYDPGKNPGMFRSVYGSPPQKLAEGGEVEENQNPWEQPAPSPEFMQQQPPETTPETPQLPSASPWNQGAVESAFEPKNPNPWNKPPQPPLMAMGRLGEVPVNSEDTPFTGFGREEKSYGKVHDIATSAERGIRKFLGPGFGEAASKVATVGTMIAPGSGEYEAMQNSVKTKQAINEGQYGEAAKEGVHGLINSTIGSIPGGALISKAAMLAGFGFAAKPGAKVPKSQSIADQISAEPGYLDTSQFKNIKGDVGKQLGYWPGGVHTAPDGSAFYLKVGPSIEQVKNENLGAKIYALAGTPVAEVGVTHIQGQPGIASKMLPNSYQLSEWKKPYHELPGLHDNFVVDAWLANHDAPGTGWENNMGNIMVSNGMATRIDTGGSLRFKGSGQTKSHFNDEADEIFSMRDPNFSETNHKVYGGISDENLQIGAQKVADVDPKALADVIARYGPTDPAEQQALYDKLLKRRQYIMDHFGVQPGGKANEPVKYPHENTPEPTAKPAPDDWWKHNTGERVRPGNDQMTPEELEKLYADTKPPIPDDFAKTKEMQAEEFAQFEKEMTSLNPKPAPSKHPYDPDSPLTEKEWDELVNQIDPSAKRPKNVPDKTSFDPNSALTEKEWAEIMKEEAKLNEGKQPFILSYKNALTEKDLAALEKGTKLTPQTLGRITFDLTSGDLETRAWDAAHSLWKIAEEVNPQTAEAIFRAMPPKIQIDIGQRIEALRDKLDYSPFNSVAKDSATTGSNPKDSAYNFYTTQTKSFKVPPNLKKDEKFNSMLEQYSSNLNKEVDVPAFSPPPPEVQKIPPKDMILYLPSNDPSMAAKDLVKGYGSDSKKIANTLYRLASEGKPEYVDKIYQHLPLSMAPDVNADLSNIISKTGDDPWKFEFKNLTPSQKKIVDVLEPVDWKNYTPKEQNFDIPKFPDEATKKKAEESGFGMKTLLWKGHSKHYDYPDEIKSFKGKHEPANFMSHRKDIAKGGYGPKTAPFVARAEKVYRINFEDYYGEANYFNVSGGVHDIIKAAESKGADIVIIDDIIDYGPLGSQAKVKQTQYAIINQEILRAPKAKFDKDKLHLARPMLGLAGGGLFIYGTSEGDRMNRGGTPMSRIMGYARGGPKSHPWNVRQQSHPRHPSGMIKSSIPGRTDKIPMGVPAGSYIIPADIPSALGEGNTMAGEKILGTMFKSGPYSPASTQSISGKLPKAKGSMPKLSFSAPKMRKAADGGEQTGSDPDIPIIAAGGEYVLHPEQVQDLGHGNMKAGHKVLDKFVLDVRKRNIETLKKLKPPKK